MFTPYVKFTTGIKVTLFKEVCQLRYTKHKYLYKSFGILAIWHSGNTKKTLQSFSSHMHEMLLSLLKLRGFWLLYKSVIPRS